MVGLCMFLSNRQWLTRGFLAVISGIVGVCAAAFFYSPTSLEQSSVKSVQALAMPRVQDVGTVGWLEPNGRVIRLAAPSHVAGGRIERILVNEGDRVQANQIVAVLDRRERLQAGLEEAETRVRVARAYLAQVQAGSKLGDIDAQRARISRLEAELAGATSEYNRYHWAHERRVVSTSDFEQKRLTRDMIAHELKRASATLVALSEVRPVDVRVAQAEVEKAPAAVQSAQKELNTAYVRAPIDGQVLKIHAWAGEIVRDAGILELGQTAEMYAVAEVYESDIDRIRLGQRCVIRADAFPDGMTGEVVHIGLLIGGKDTLDVDPTADVDARIVEVKIRLDPQSSQRVSRLTHLRVRVQIQVNEG